MVLENNPIWLSPSDALQDGMNFYCRFRSFVCAGHARHLLEPVALVLRCLYQHDYVVGLDNIGRQLDSLVQFVTKERLEPHSGIKASRLLSLPRREKQLEPGSVQVLMLW